jgi:hypothetical protein
METKIMADRIEAATRAAIDAVKAGASEEAAMAQLRRDIVAIAAEQLSDTYEALDR